MTSRLFTRSDDVYHSSESGSPALREFVELVRYRDLVRQLALRNIKIRYKRSVLGVAWSLLNPLLTMAVLAIVFTAIFQSATPHYMLYLLPGLLLWNFFAQTTATMAAEIIGGGDLWRRIYTPRTVFAVATVSTGLVHLALALIPLAGVVAFVRPPLGVALLAIPVAVVATMAFALGVGLAVSALAHRFVDVVDMYQILLTAWMYFTPVIYPRSIVSERHQWIFAVNPMVYFVDWFRAPFDTNVLPSAASFGIGLTAAFGTLIVGWWLFAQSAERSATRG